MEKTVQYWLETIADEEIRTKAIENAREAGSVNRIYDSLWKAICHGFNSGSSKEGSEYWRRIALSAENGTLATRPHPSEVKQEVPKVAVLCTEQNKGERLIKAFEVIGVKNMGGLQVSSIDEFYCPDDDNNLSIYSGKNIIAEYRIITIEELEAMGRGEAEQTTEKQTVEMIQSAIDLLKSHGYKILKLQTEFKEI